MLYLRRSKGKQPQQENIEKLKILAISVHLCYTNYEVREAKDLKKKTSKKIKKHLTIKTQWFIIVSVKDKS